MTKKHDLTEEIRATVFAAKTPPEQVRAIIDEELEAAQARIIARVAPLLKAEFDVQARRHKRLRRVLFGNGTHYIDIGGYDGRGLPKSLATLDAMCDIASGDTHYIVAYDENLER